MIDPHYPTRIAVYIDILAFATDVLLTDARPGLYLTHDALLRRIAKCSADIDGARASGAARDDARMEYISDSIFMSFADRPGAMLHAMANAAFLAHAILRGGYIFRGAIGIGPLAHDDQVLWGRAVVEVVNMEERSVNTPRIALNSAAASRAKGELAAGGYREDQYIRDRGDGPFVHVLGNDWSFLKEERQRLPMAGLDPAQVIAEMFNEMRDSLQLRFRNAPDERARKKLRWLADYINETIAEQHGSPDWQVKLPTTSPLVLMRERVRFLRTWLMTLRQMP